MHTAFFSITRRLKRILQSTSQSQLTFLPSTRLCSGTREPPRPRLQTALWPFKKPSASLVPEIERWIEEGNSVQLRELQSTIRALRKLKRFKQALEVSEWMQQKSNLSFGPADNAVRLDLIGAVKGVSEAEDYFNELPEKDKNVKAYGALLNCYVRESLVDKAEAHMAKMKQLGLAFNYVPYNDMMCLYAALGQHEKVHSVLAEMKHEGVFPNNFTYKICIDSYAKQSDITSIEKLLIEMKQQPQIIMDWNTYTTVANIYVKFGFPDKAVLALKKAEEMAKGTAVAYNHMISLYGLLGDKSAILRLWKLRKNCKRLVNRDYIVILSSLVKMGELEEAEILLKEWDSGLNVRDFGVLNIVLVGYQTNGLTEKAEALLDEYVKKGKKPPSSSWGIVAAGYAEKGEMEKAHEMMKNALREYVPNAGWTPNLEIVRSILRYLGENSNLVVVETFIGLLKEARPMDSNMYYALIRARIRAGKGVDDLLKGMQDDGIQQNKRIRRILTLEESRKVGADILSVMVNSKD